MRSRDCSASADSPSSVCETPMLHHDRLEDLAVVDRQVVDTGAGDRARVRREIGDARTRHLELADLTLDREHHRRRIDRDRGGRRGRGRRGSAGSRRPRRAPSRGSRTRRRAVVPYCDARDASRVPAARRTPSASAGEAGCGTCPPDTCCIRASSSATGSMRAGHDQVVTYHHGVTHLFCGPASRPRAPYLGAVRALRVVVAEHAKDGLEVIRQVVFGEEVDEERAAHRGRQREALGVPGLSGHDPGGAVPGHELVRHPRLRRRAGDGRRVARPSARDPGRDQWRWGVWGARVTAYRLVGR